MAWYPGIDEFRVVFMDNTIPLALALQHRTGIADSARRPGLYTQEQGPIVTPLDVVRPRVPSVQAETRARRGRV